MTDIQFGVMLIFNMCLGNITPPVGSVLFVGCGISKLRIEDVTKMLLPYFAVLFLILLAVTYIPALSWRSESYGTDLKAPPAVPANLHSTASDPLLQPASGLPVYRMLPIKAWFVRMDQAFMLPKRDSQCRASFLFPAVLHLP